MSIENVSRNLFKQNSKVDKLTREKVLGQTGGVIWFTGLSGSGKSTLAQALEQELFARGHAAYILDGDNIRRQLNADLTFSAGDRSENIRRVAAVADLFREAGLVCMASFIAPFREDRELARKTIGPEHFAMIYVSTPLAECEKRDPKGLYKKARRGEIHDFTGINSPYEAPDDVDLSIDTSRQSISESLALIMDLVRKKGFI